MKRMVKKAISIFIIVLATAESVAVNADSANNYPNYYEAKRALDRGDCDAAVDYLNAFLRKHSYVREKYRDFYLELKLVMGQCRGSIRATGIGGESSNIDPLPDDLPMDN